MCIVNLRELTVTIDVCIPVLYVIDKRQCFPHLIVYNCMYNVYETIKGDYICPRYYILLN